MASTKKNKTAEELATDLIELSDKYRKAYRKGPISIANRHAGRIYQVLQLFLAKGESGRTVLENLLNHPIAQVRLYSAGTMLRLDLAPKLAIPVLAHLLIDEVIPDTEPFERVALRSSANDVLMRHFGIESGISEELLEPLREYGIELPYRHRA